jgi:CHAD domain-containing protein
MTTMQSYAEEQLARLLHKLAEESAKAAKKPNPEAVHDLRVACRRMTETIRTFLSLLDEEAARKTRKRIRGVLNLAGDVRNRDIALELMKAAGVPARSAMRREQLLRRRQALEALKVALEDWAERDWPNHWRKRLGIPR